MYPRNSATPPRIAIGAVIQISDGAVQSSGVSVVVRPEGGSETAGGGTVSYGGSSNVVYYAPTQAETNYTAFVVTAYKTGCIPVSKTVITTESATAGRAYLAAGDVSGNLPSNIKAISDDTTAADNLEAAADGTGYNLGGGQVVAASVTDKTNFALTTAYDAAKSAASQSSVDAIDANVDAILEDTGTTIPATLATIDGRIDTEIGTLVTNVATILAAVDTEIQTLLTNLATVDANVDAILEDTGTTLPATLSTIDGKADAILTDTGTDIPTTLTTIAGYIDTEVAAIKAKTDNLPSDPADASDIAASFTSIASTLSTIATYIDTEVAAIKAKTDNLPASPAATGDIPTASDIATQVRTELTTELGRLDAAVSTRATPAQVNEQVLDVLSTDTFAELAGVPAATSSLKDKLTWVFMLHRNKITQTSGTQAVRNDADSASVATSTTSDDGSTFTRGEYT